MKGMIRYLLSFLYPVAMNRYYSEINGSLEINMINGKKVLDSDTTNYSYGSLQRILRRGLFEAHFDSSIDKVLVLGLGGGSVVETIREEFESDAFIELVDIDPVIIEIARREFDVERYGNLRIVKADAFDFIRGTKELYDIIVVDVFVKDTIPVVFTGESFISGLLSRLTKEGRIVYNTLNSTMKDEARRIIQERLSKSKAGVRLIRNVEHSNTLVIAGES